MVQFYSLLNEYYDHIYVLSVKTAEERRKLFAERFNGLNYTFYYGADKNEFTIPELVDRGIYDEILTKKHHRYSKSMLPGEIACAWSHKMMYQDMLDKGYDRVLIFEDDAVPDPKILTEIPDILNEVPAYAELLFWGWNKNGEDNLQTTIKKNIYHLQHTLGLLKWNHTIINNLYARTFSAHLKKAGFHDYTYAYAITATGARKLLALQQPIQYVADNLLSIASARNLLQAFITFPPVFLHDALPDGTARDSYIR